MSQTKRKQKFPDDAELTEMRDLLSTGPAARPLSKNADPVQRFKHVICEEFVKYLNNHNLTQKQLAAQISIDEALVSKIVNYLYDDFTVDRLVKYLSVLYPKVDIRLLVA